MKNKNTIYWIVGIIILLLVLNSFGIFKTTFFSIESTSIKFRTSNLYYGSTSLIAYTKSCGSTLIKYGENGEYATTLGSCISARSITNSPITYLFDVPGKVTANGVDDSSIITKNALYNDSNGVLYVCSDFTSGGYHILVYKSSVSKLGYDVSDSPQPIDSLMEVPCFQTCNTPADADCNNIVDRAELGNYITSWVMGSVTRDNLGQAIVAWVGG